MCPGDPTGTVAGVDEGRSLPLTQRLSRRPWIAIDVVVAVMLATSSILATALGEQQHPSGAPWDAIRYAAILVACLPLPLRRRDPIRALYLVAPAIVVLAALGGRGPTLITAAAVVYSVAATTGRRISLRAVLAVVGGTVVGAMFASGGPAWASVLALPPVIVVGWLAGENTRQPAGLRPGAGGAGERSGNASGPSAPCGRWPTNGSGSPATSTTPSPTP